MEFEINKQRQDYLSAKGRVVLNACPGSGKTTIIAKKLTELQKEYSSLYGKYSGVACLSFTNTAKDEINEKYYSLNGRPIDFPHKVSTIDSFINQHITLPFYNLLNRGFKRPKILDTTGILDEMWITSYTDKSGKLQQGVKRPLNNFKAKNNRSIFYTYAPSTIRIEPNGSYSINGKNPSAEKVDIATFKEYCDHLKKTQFTKGLISTSDSAYIALHLLNKFPNIGKWLTLRFPHLIIDEAQDNSEMQHAIFDKLLEQGLTHIDLVGDPYQSLYQWRDANPELFLNKFNDGENWKGLELTDNRRSPQNIIDCFSLLRSANEPNIKTACPVDKSIPIYIYKYNETNSSLIVEDFDKQCKNYGLVHNQIVVRGKSLKNKMLGRTADQKPWKNDTPYSLIEAKNRYLGNEIKDAIKIIRSTVVTLIAPYTEYHEIKAFEKELKYDHHFNALLLEVLHETPSFELSIKDWTNRAQDFLQKKLKIEDEINFELKNRQSKYFDKSIVEEPVEKHFRKAYTQSKIPITTVHQVKGKTLDAILVFFNAKKHKDNITFEDIVSNQEEFLSEKQRIIYVAMSRPKHLLSMAFPDSIADSDLIHKFGNKIHIVSADTLVG